MEAGSPEVLPHVSVETKGINLTQGALHKLLHANSDKGKINGSPAALFGDLSEQSGSSLRAAGRLSLDP